MKKTNLITILSLVSLTVAVIMFIFLWKTPSKKSSAESGDSTVESKITSSNYNNSTESSDKNTQTENSTNSNSIYIATNGALFIGDSRTVGLMEYSCIDNADFFANVGMSVYNIHKKAIPVPKVGKVTLTELLDNKKYDKIYIMLGINEIGYKLENTVTEYDNLIKFIKEKQPNAIIFIEANIHVIKSRSDSDKVVNNTAIDTLNHAVSKFANNKDIFYIDANVIFDDENKSLSSDKTEDGAHLYAKYYKEWGDWIVNQTAALIKEE